MSSNSRVRLLVVAVLAALSISLGVIIPGASADGDAEEAAGEAPMHREESMAVTIHLSGSNTRGHGFAVLPTIVFGDLNWSSARLQNQIVRYIIENGYGYPTSLASGSTQSLFQALREGDSHVIMEVWLPSQIEAWEEALAAEDVLSLGTSLGTDWQSSFVIPAYLQEQYPGLDSVEDLKEQRYKELFATAESGGKARLVSCVIGWACEVVNATQIEGYGLSDHLHVVNPVDAAAFDANLQGAYERREPWLGYQWGTSDIALLLDLVRLEEPEYSDECWRTTKACAYQDDMILIGAHSSLPDLAPDVVDFLRNWDFSTEVHLRNAARWQADNPSSSIEDTALYWLSNNVDTWSQWVTDQAATDILAALDKDALVALYNSTGGAGWTNKDGWLTDTHIGQWHGVTTDSSGRVTSLDLTSNQLSGAIPSELGNLTNLETLLLNSNRLTGEIPSTLADLSKLIELRLSGNQLTGCIPSTLKDVASNDLADLGLPFCGTQSPENPTVSVSATSTKVRIGSAIPVTATFSESVSGFTVDDVSVANGSAGNFVGSDGNSVFTFDVTPNAIGVVTVDVSQDAAVDSEGNGNTAAAQLRLGMPYDDDNDGIISGIEVLSGVRDYFLDILTGQQVLELVRLYFSSPG